VLALAAAGWGISQIGGEPPRRLDDGSLLTLEAVTYGQEHAVVIGPPWARLLRHVVPPNLHAEFDRRFRCNVLTQSTAPLDTLAVWTRRRGVTVAGGTSFPGRIIATDEHGYGSGIFGYSRSLDSGSQEFVQMWPLPVFPRRGRTVTLRAQMLNAERKWRSGFEFTVPNPTPGPYAVWTVRPLPQTQRTDDLSVTLTGLSAGVRPSGIYDPFAMHLFVGQPWTRAEFRVTRGNRPAPEWQPLQITVSDPTGNLWTEHTLSTYQQEPPEVFFIRGVPWPEDPVWKLRVELARCRSFVPEELWMFRDLPAPRPSKGAWPDRVVRRGNRTFTVESISVLNLPPSSGPRSPINGGIQVHLAPPSDDLVVSLVRVGDDRGRVVNKNWFGYRMRQGQHFVGFQLPTGAKSLDLTFAVQKSRFVEFVAQPARHVRPAQANKR
jgi:hypothetical protein